MKNHKILAAAILREAARDYQTALVKKDEKRIEYFEQWFVSDWAQLLSGDMGEIIIMKCREHGSVGKEQWLNMDRKKRRKRRKNECATERGFGSDERTSL